MAEKRQFTHSICVKIGAKTVAKIECFPAEQWQGKIGSFRLRCNRRWMDAPDGQPLYLEPARIGDMVASTAFGSAQPCPRPLLRRGDWVRVPTNVLAGQPLYQKSRALTEPIQGVDGQWYVAVSVFGQGIFMAPVQSLVII